jgi:hypothetical protein
MLPHRPSDAATSLVCTARTACVVGFVAGRDLVAIHANDLAFAHRDFPKTDIETPDYP